MSNPIPEVAPDGWAGVATQQLTAPDGTTVVLQRAAAGELARAYPVGRGDVSVRIESVGSEPAPALATLIQSIWQADPECRRIVLAVPSEDESLRAIAEEAGLGRAIEVDLGADRVVQLMIAESEEAKKVTGEVEEMPGG